jgi:hypothetical protein
MTKEEIKSIVDEFNQRCSVGGTSLELIDFDGSTLKLKLNCPSKDVFKVQGKIVTFEEETKKFAEKQLKQKTGDINIIFV